MNIKIPQKINPLVIALVFITFTQILSAATVWTNNGTRSGWSTIYDIYNYSVDQVSSPTQAGSTALKMECRFGQNNGGANRYHAECIKKNMAVKHQTRIEDFRVRLYNWVYAADHVVFHQIVDFWPNAGNIWKPLKNIHTEDEGVRGRRYWWDGSSWNQAYYGPYMNLSKNTYHRMKTQILWKGSDLGSIKFWVNGVLKANESNITTFPANETKAADYRNGCYASEWFAGAGVSEGVTQRVVYIDSIAIYN